jgi:SAM-dependent methyltransferase
MKLKHFQTYLENTHRLDVENYDEMDSTSILEGRLISKADGSVILIRKGIPRFISDKNYSDNFGLQWNIFRSTQLDSCTGLPLSSRRFAENTKWTKDQLAGKSVLEVGSGAGRFTEIMLQAGARLVSIDNSTAVDANYSSNSGKGDLFLLQADLREIPFSAGSFDFVFCYGVLQHTPDPLKAYSKIYEMLKPGGRISIDYYLKSFRPSPWSFPKYFWRPLTSRMNPLTLYKIVKAYMPLYLPIDTFLRKIPKHGEDICALIPVPCWNYLDFGLNEKQRLEWAIMDTFDALGARYDFPKTLKEVEAMVRSDQNETCEVFYGSNGVVANIQKKTVASERS